MRNKLLFILGQVMLSFLLINQISFDMFSATCTGADPCHACKNCHYCKRCAKTVLYTWIIGAISALALAAGLSGLVYLSR